MELGSSVKTLHSDRGSIGGPITGAHHIEWTMDEYRFCTKML